MNRADREFLESLPPVKLVLAYGSGVFPQLALDRLVTQHTRDYIVIVDNPIEWLLQAVERHPDHFPWWLRSLRRPELVAWLQRFGAGMFFIPPMPLATPAAGSIKYGVIAEEVLLEDVKQWLYFYAAGRLQKPVEAVLLSNMNQAEAQACALRVHQANRTHNLLQAMRLSVLLCAGADMGPRMVPVLTLLERIVGLSYTSDIRMHSGLENPNKVRNILRANTDRFLGMYAAALTQLQHDGLFERIDVRPVAASSTESLQWRADDLLDLSALFRSDVHGQRRRYHLLAPLLQLPLFKGIQHESELRRLPYSYPQVAKRFQGPVVVEFFAEALGALLRRRVLRSSVSQAVKGLITAGPTRSLQYLWGKWRRRWN
ncbi:hypothetical protein CCYA_CCYA02G0504 [Cyanidiococcus yangmingshanensis]|nr:hypothetical protein CCYA_CCYA02G0504 [Cyanidiococcus yangmingshanensis]